MTFSLPRTACGIPQIGIGSGSYYYKGSRVGINDALVTVLENAVKAGFVHLDSAECYDNDEELRKVLDDVLKSGVSREDLFITDKYWVGDATYSTRSASSNPYERAKKICQDLNVEYLDLYLLHSPFVKEETHGFDLKQAWKFMQQALDEGLVKRIGVSNFRVADMEIVMDASSNSMPPTVNQIEFNAFLQNQTPGIVEYCRARNITIEAYSPLGPLTAGDLSKGPGLAFDNYLAELVEKHGKSKTQLLLRWVMQQGIIPLTTTTKVERLKEFQGVFDFELTTEEVNRIKTLGAAYKPALRQYWIPEFSHFDK